MEGLSSCWERALSILTKSRVDGSNLHSTNFWINTTMVERPMKAETKQNKNNDNKKSWAQTLGRSVKIIKNPYFGTCFLYSKVKQSCERWSQEPSKLLEFHFSHLQNWNCSFCFVEFLICYSTYILWFGCVYLSCSVNFHGGWKEIAVVGERNTKNKQLPI